MPPSMGDNPQKVHVPSKVPVPLNGARPPKRRVSPQRCTSHESWLRACAGKGKGPCCRSLRCCRLRRLCAASVAWPLGHIPIKVAMESSGLCPGQLHNISSTITHRQSQPTCHGQRISLCHCRTSHFLLGPHHNLARLGPGTPWIRDLGPETWDLGPGAPRPGTWGAMTWDLGPGTWDLGRHDLGPGTWNAWDLVTWDQGPGT
jgi:hypothetical protein